MSELSERAYYARWMEGLEYALWRAVTVGPFQYGHLTLTAEHAQWLKALSEACGGWIEFDQDARESFVPAARWLEQYQVPAKPPTITKSILASQSRWIS